MYNRVLTLLGTLIFYLNITHPSNHSHLCPLKCHLIFFPYRPGLTSMQHTTVHTTAVQSPSHYILIGKQWYQLPEFIPSNSNSGLHSCISISIHTRQNSSTNSRYALAPISTLAQPVLVTGFKQPLQINVFITLDMLPFIPLHFLCTHF